MENQILYPIMALSIYAIILIYSILSSNRANGLNIENFSRGNGKYSFWFISIVMAVTMVGPADALALSQNGLKYGLAWSIFPIGAALAQLVTGIFFASKVKESYGSIQSIGDIYIDKCSKSSSIVSGSIAFIQSIAFSGVLILAGGQVLQTFMGVEKIYGMILTALLVGGYTSYRGMVAVMKTDLFQGIFMGVMMILLIVACSIAIAHTSVDFKSILLTSSFNTDYNLSSILTMFLGYFLGELLLPTYIMRASVSESTTAASKGFIFASVILIFWYLLITFSGALGNIILPLGQQSEELILLSILRHYITVNTTAYYLMGGFVFLVFISLIHSTFDSFLNNGAISFSRDIVGKFVKLNDKQNLWLSQQATIGIAFLGLFIAIWKNDLIDILFLGYTVWVPTILASLIWILLNKGEKLKALSFWIGIIVGISFWILFEYIFKDTIPSTLIGLIMNYVAILIIQKNSK